MPKALVHDIEIHYEVHGRGEPLLLIAGLVGVGASWGPQIPLFAEDFLTLVPDHRGTGRSGIPEGGYTIEQHASDMAELVRGLKCGPVHIVGSSTGGAIAQVMALDHPEVVRSIAMSASWARSDEGFRLQFEVRKRALQDCGLRAYAESSALFLFSPSFVRANYGRVRQWIETQTLEPAQLKALAKRIDMIIAHNQLDRLGRIQNPVLVMVGREDFCTPPYLSEELAEAIPGAELEILEGGHLSYLESPEVFHGRVREFLLKH